LAGNELIKKVKMIFGKRWNPQGKYWEVPYSEDLMAKQSKVAACTFNIIIDALKFYYEENFTYEIRRPKKIKNCLLS